MRRRTAIVVSSATHEKDEEAASQQKTTDTTKSTQTNTQQTTTTSTTPPPTQTTSGQLPIGTVVTSLPKDCVSTPVDNVEYYHCGPDYYRSAYQGNNLVYVTTDPPK
jgi:hypothetical protein